LGACGSEVAPSAPPPPVGTSAAAASRTPVEATPVDPRDQYALATAMLEAEAAAPNERASAHERVREQWRARRVRWEMMRVEGLCRGGGDCFFAPFDLARLGGRAHFAFLPRVRFTEAEHARTSGACAAYGSECVVTVEGTLDDLGFSVGAPTSIAIVDAAFVSARARRDGEHFLSRPAREQPASAQRAGPE
ncbi:MAG: hypothetical protein M3Y87_16590, partial [Myxococcota bacterium]|nr:hypothetical protein [Myxococcota bacterium]